MRRPPRIAVLIAALAGAALWVALDFRSQPAATRTAAAPAAASAPDARVSSETPLEIPDRLALRRFRSDPFSTPSWAPPPAKAAAPTEPPAPVAPPLPFRFAGQFQRDSGTEIYLGRGTEIFAVKEGDTLDGQYKVESVGPGEVAFVHLPSGTRQALQFSALREEGMTAQGAPARVARAPFSAPVSPGAQPANSASALPGEAAPARAGPAQLRWDGPASTRTGANFKLSLRVTSGEHIRAAPMQVRFDPAVLESISVKPGRYFGAEKGAFGYRVNPDGSIFVGASNPAPAPVSDAEFLVLTFRPIKAAPAEVSIASLNLQGAAGRAIAYSGVMPFKTTVTP